MGDDHTCRLVGKDTVHIRMYDEILRELKEVRYIPRRMKNLISVGALKADDIRGTLEEGVLTMSSSSLVVLKGITRNNVYYLMGSAVTRLASLGQLNGDSIISWHSGNGEVSLKSDQASGGASISHLKACDSSVLDKKKMKFGADAHHLHGLINCVHVDVWGPIKNTSLGGDQ